jgi:hypothetical protein
VSNGSSTTLKMINNYWKMKKEDNWGAKTGNEHRAIGG